MLDSKFWAKYFQVYDTLNSLITYQELIETICDELDIKKGEKILEAGCGTGNLALKIKEKGADVTGLDNCQEALNIYLKKDLNAKIILADLRESLPFPDDYFDKIVLNNTLYTLNSEKQSFALKELYRILKKKGKIIISNPLKNSHPILIYLDELIKSYKLKGFFPTVINNFKLIIPAIKIIYYNNLIIREDQNGYFNFLKLNEQKIMLEKVSFKNISDNKIVYSRQAVLNRAEK